MSALESDSKPTIERLLTGSGIFRLHPAQQAIVARWAVKTAMVFETTAPPPPKSKGHFYPQDECEQLRLNSAIPPRTIVWLGQFSGVGLWESGTHPVFGTMGKSANALRMGKSSRSSSTTWPFRFSLFTS